MKVAVGSLNPVKIEAVENVLSKLYEDVEVFGVDVKSGIPDQPIGNKTIEGALNRAKNARQKTGADWGVGIEAGLFKVPYTQSGYVDIQWCVVVDREGRVTLGCNSGFEYPPQVIDAVFRDEKEIGEVMDELTGIKDLGKKIGAIGILTKGHLNRTEMTEQAVLMAFIPRMNEKLYFKT